jgi:serine/threonine protein kinase/Flp pilus assembly protein TadD
VREQSIFIEALEREDPAERSAFLEGACAGDLDLRRRIERLLLRHEQPSSFLRLPEPSIVSAGPPPIGERPGELIGPYKLLEQIGEGGFGVVFMAEQMQPVRRKVALKVLKPGMDTRQVVARFEAERQALALMDHPNIARVFDGGVTPSGRPFFVMELVKGVTITDFCDRNQLTPRQRLELFVPICQAVQHAHQKGVIHRDLKPSNVLVSLHDTTPVVTVIDFGVAKALGQELTDKTLFTGFSQLIGTPTYMSPEQAGHSGLDVDTRSDIYALGVLVFELLTGTTPFDQERLRTAGYDEICRIIREEEAPRPSARVSTLGSATATVSANRRSDPQKLRRLMRGELDWIVMRALEKDRNRRYESASAFAADVQRYLNDEPVQACPPSPWYRFRKYFRRNKAGLSILALALLSVVLIGAGVGWSVRDRAARRAKLSFEVGRALDDAARAREQALTLTDNPALWEASLAEAASDLKRARGLATRDDIVPEPAIRERLQELQSLVDADEADRRFAARFEEVLFQGYEDRVSGPKTEIAFAAQKDAFRRYYGIVFGETIVEEAATILKNRPPPIRDLLWGALDVCLQHLAKDDAQVRPWLTALLEAADSGPWRKQARDAVRMGDWKAFEQVVEAAVAARQPPPLLDWLIAKSPGDSPIRLRLLQRFRQAYPGDFWANHSLAGYLHYGLSRPNEAIRYYTAALALRPHNPVACVNLGDALRATGDLDGAISAYREALDGHPNYAYARQHLSVVLDEKGDSDGAIAELRETIRLRSFAPDHIFLGDMLARKGLRDEAIASYREAIECCRRAVSLNPISPGSLNDLAWLLVTCPHVPLRDPAEGVKLARRAVELEPDDASHWNTLGVAYYRAGKWDEAVAALTKSVELNGGDSNDYFFLATSHWQLGERKTARRCFDQAVQWMDKHKPTSRELSRFRTEAADLMDSTKH